ncbi:uncharacterized protein LOC127284378 [Leptopilina boulardi]|uniref:uncharacterized protein LOC127284378 n=1 Tax=Leptopilina boulardi TaxID=63433 RepID=UPI0021F6164E|nr:uncharacterized protein LOC127284378 [Leptopilina boulardi]
MATQTIQFANLIPSANDEAEQESNRLRTENEELKRQVAAQAAQIITLTRVIDSFPNVSPQPNAAAQNNFNLDDIRNMMREERERDRGMAPGRQQQLPDENVLRNYLGNRDSRVMYAGVEITNSALQKAKSDTKFSLRLNHVVSGYWLPEQIPFVAAVRAPNGVSKDDFIEILDVDVMNIQKILTSLQELHRIDEITPEILQFTALKKRIVNALSYLRRD